MSLLVGDGHLAQLAVNALDQGKGAVVLQRIHQHLAEGVLLDAHSHRRAGVEDSVDEFIPSVILGAVVEQCAVQVRGPVVEGREEEAELGSRDGPVRAAIVEGLLCGVIAEGGAALLDRADRADKIGELGIAALVAGLAVLRAVGHVVGIAGQQDQHADVFTEADRGGDLAVEGVAGFGVGELGITELHQQTVLLAGLDLGRGKYEIGKGLPHRAGDRLFEQLMVFLLLLHGEQGNGIVKQGDDLAELVDIAAVDFRDVTPIRAQSAPQLGSFLVDHGAFLCFFKLQEELYHAPRGNASANP